MDVILKSLFTFFTTICLFFTNLFSPATMLPESENFDFSFLQYPDEAIVTLEEAGLTEAELTGRADADLPEYVQSGGYDDINGITISPYYTAKIGDTDIPVFASVVFIKSDETGTLHSFSEIYVDSSSDFSFNIELTSADVQLKNAIVLPESHGVSAYCKNGVVSASINEPGIYTFLFNGAKQHYGYTLFVREEINEDAEIAAYVEEYGEDNVIIVEKGFHTLDYANYVDRDNFVIYLKQGAYIIANHHYDINSLEDEGKYNEQGAFEHNTIHLTRYPFVNFHRCKNITLAGRGVLDLTRLDRRERRGVVFTNCEDITVKDIKIINSPEWSFITYTCKNLTVENVDIIGNRGNCDGFAVCNTENALITNCFGRTADDIFEVKALGSEMGSKNITFSDCIAWGGYARCFGICGETSRSIEDITFRDCAVIYRDGVWDNDRIGSLVVVAEQCDGSIDGVLFENIEIFRDEGRPMLVKIYDEEKENFSIENVEFRNIKYTSYMSPKFAGNGSDTNTVQVKLSDIEANGIKMTIPSLFCEIGKYCDITTG